jgi:hypothetical protein
MLRAEKLLWEGTPHPPLVQNQVQLYHHVVKVRAHGVGNQGVIGDSNLNVRI